MEDSDILQTIAEIAIAITGFTGIVVALGAGRGRVLSGFSQVRFRILLYASLLALTLALLPLFWQHLGFSPGVSWSICSGFVIVIMVPMVIFDARSFRSHSAEIGALERRTAPFIACVGTALWLTQMASAFHWHAFGPYLAAPLWFLAFSAFLFCRLLIKTQASFEPS